MTCAITPFSLAVLEPPPPTPHPSPPRATVRADGASSESAAYAEQRWLLGPVSPLDLPQPGVGRLYDERGMFCDSQSVCMCVCVVVVGGGVSCSWGKLIQMGRGGSSCVVVAGVNWDHLGGNTLLSSFKQGEIYRVVKIRLPETFSLKRKSWPVEHTLGPRQPVHRGAPPSLHSGASCQKPQVCQVDPELWGKCLSALRGWSQRESGHINAHNPWFVSDSCCLNGSPAIRHTWQQITLVI